MTTAIVNPYADTTRFRKGSDGHQAETIVALEDTPRGSLRLHILTAKASNGGIFSTAQVEFLKDGVVTFIVFGDWRKNLKHDRTARCTAKSITDLHLSSLEQVDSLKADVAAFYAKKGYNE